MERKTHRDASSIDTVVTVGDVRFGADPFPVIAGPCVIDEDCGGSCLPTGDPCTSNAECCSGRCHPAKHVCK